MENNAHIIVATPLGFFKIQASPEGLIQAAFVTQHKTESLLESESENTIESTLLKDTNPKTTVLLQEAAGQLEQYFAGTLTQFTLPMAPEGTAFQRRVWLSLQQIPYGKTQTYAEQSKALGNPKAIRAVAAANGQNPLAIFIPCHRVIGANGSLTGYAWGLEKKSALLDLEHPPIQLPLF